MIADVLETCSDEVALSLALRLDAWCIHCAGSGEVGEDECNDCDGHGHPAGLPPLTRDEASVLHAWVAAARAELVASKRKTARWRARCPVTDAEVEDRGLTMEHARAWLIAKGYDVQAHEVCQFDLWVDVNGMRCWLCDADGLADTIMELGIQPGHPDQWQIFEEMLDAPPGCPS